jgi:hypothetical protein
MLSRQKVYITSNFMELHYSQCTEMVQRLTGWVGMRTPSLGGGTAEFMAPGSGDMTVPEVACLKDACWMVGHNNWVTDLVFTLMASITIL